MVQIQYFAGALLASWTLGSIMVASGEGICSIRDALPSSYGSWNDLMIPGKHWAHKVFYIGAVDKISPFYSIRSLLFLYYQKNYKVHERGRMGIRMMSGGSTRMVYHRPKCIYVRRIYKKNRLQMNWEDAEWKGYRPCKYCDGVDDSYKLKQNKIELYAEQFHMDVDLKDNKILSGPMWDVGRLFTKFVIRGSFCFTENM